MLVVASGNTSQAKREQPATTVYPRWRGEHEFEDELVKNTYGLSPLARGTLQPRLPPFRPARFIPAGAGNTGPGFEIRLKDPVYPRWRGEHFAINCLTVIVIGLSPLARGTRRDRHVFVGVGRFIPAGAGNTPQQLTRYPPSPVYPRWRGEHGSKDRKQDVYFGLSPLARGTHCRHYQAPGWTRFIPAGAGNTFSLHIY